jgi:cysteine desulfurase
MDMTPHFPIYMDYGATNPCDPRVVDAMIPWLREHFGNPASRSHAWGWEAEEAVEKARGQVAALIGADPREIVWTSGATESNNLASRAPPLLQEQGQAPHHGQDRAQGRAGHHARAGAPGFRGDLPGRAGRRPARPGGFKAAIRPDTILASVMFVNNEIGVIQDIPAIGAICREKGVIFHVDAAQATGQGRHRPGPCRWT